MHVIDQIISLTNFYWHEIKFVWIVRIRKVYITKLISTKNMCGLAEWQIWLKRLAEYCRVSVPLYSHTPLRKNKSERIDDIAYKKLFVDAIVSNVFWLPCILVSRPLPSVGSSVSVKLSALIIGRKWHSKHICVHWIKSSKAQISSPGRLREATTNWQSERTDLDNYLICTFKTSSSLLAVCYVFN